MKKNLIVFLIAIAPLASQAIQIRASAKDYTLSARVEQGYNVVDVVVAGIGVVKKVATIDNRYLDETGVNAIKAYYISLDKLATQTKKMIVIDTSQNEIDKVLTLDSSVSQSSAIKN